MIPDYPGCEKCPLKDRPPVFGKGDPHAEILILGEAPGRNEVIKKEPFVGLSGKLLRETLKQVIPSTSLYITNACLCHPEDNKTPTPTAIKCCRERLLREISEVQPQKILVAGGSALSALLTPGKSIPITKWRGLGFNWEYGVEARIGEEDIIDSIPALVVATYHPAAILRDPDLFRDFTRDVVKIASQDAPLPTPKPTVIIPETPEEALDYLEEFSEASMLSCDLETTGFSPLSDVILSWGFGALQADGFNGASIILPTGLGIVEDPRVARALRLLITEYQGPMIFHNLKFDLQFIQVWAGEYISPKNPQDTMLMQYAQDERGTGTETDSGGSGRGYHIHGLKDQARIRYDIPDYHFDFKEFYAKPGIIARVAKIRGLEYIEEDLEKDLDAWDEMFHYQGEDCYVTCRLYQDLERELEEESPRLLPLVRGHLVPGAVRLSEIELTGAPVDLAYLEGERDRLQKELSDGEALIKASAKEVGFDDDFNPQSSLQAKKYMEKLLGTSLTSGEREIVLLELHTHKYSEEIVQKIHTLIDWRQMARTLKKDIIGLLERIDVDGRIRPDYLLHGSATGRLACRDPNLQNIPTLMGPIIRKAFVSGDPDYLLMEADESQLELRVAAELSQDDAMIEIFRQNGDIHRKVASDMFGKPPAEISKHERYLAKYVDFGVIYGRGAKSLTEGWEAQYIVDNLGGRAWTLREAQQFIDNFLNGVPGLKKWIESQQKFVRANHYVETPMGRRRRFPFVGKDQASSIDRQGVNSPIQSYGSDIVFSAVCRIAPQLPDGAVILPILVHDSLMLRVRKDLIEEVYQLVKRELETPPLPMVTPLRADFKIGYAWGDMTPYPPEEEK